MREARTALVPRNKFAFKRKSQPAAAEKKEEVKAESNDNKENKLETATEGRCNLNFYIYFLCLLFSHKESYGPYNR